MADWKRVKSAPVGVQVGESAINGREPSLTCRVREFSDNKATIEIASHRLITAGELPPRCRLHVPLLRIDRPCRAVWRSGKDRARVHDVSVTASCSVLTQYSAA